MPLLDAAETSCLCVVVATKCDLLSDTVSRVPREQALQFTRSLNSGRDLPEIPYFETSSLTGQNVERVFEVIFNTVLSHIKQKPSTEKTQSSKGSVDLNSNTTAQGTPVQSKCC